MLLTSKWVNVVFFTASYSRDSLYPNQLRESSAVEYIEEDGVVFANTVASWGLDRVDQLALPLDDVFEPIGDGSGVDVYVIDTGINEGHVDFGDRSSIGFDAIGGSVNII